MGSRITSHRSGSATSRRRLSNAIACPSPVASNTPSKVSIDSSSTSWTPEAWINPGRYDWDLKEVEANDQEKASLTRNTLAPKASPIPKILHFIWISHPGQIGEINFASYLAIKSALVRMNPEEVQLHVTRLKPHQQWNEWMKDLAGSIKVVQHTEDHVFKDTEAFNTLQHITDRLRLRILRDIGGAYLDTDVYILGSWDYIWNCGSDVIMGHEEYLRAKLCNAVIMAKPESPFIIRWLQEYDNFDPKKRWEYYGCTRPKEISSEEAYKEEVATLSVSTFFWPKGARNHLLFMHNELDTEEKRDLLRTMKQNNGSLYKDQVSYHGWNHHIPPLFKNLTPHMVETIDTRFHLLMRDVLKAKLPSKRHQPLVVTYDSEVAVAKGRRG